MNRIAGFVMLTRPVNVVICAVSVVCGGIVASGRPGDVVGNEIAAVCSGDLSETFARILAAALSASCILAAGNAFNDVRDVPADRINAPRRPVASGLVSPGGATLFAALLACPGLLLAILLGFSGILVAAAAAILLAAYDIRLKGVPLAGNAAVAVLGGLAFIYGGIAGGGVWRALAPAAFATLFHLGRELIKDMADFDGDKSVGINSTAVAWGMKTTGILAAAALAMLAAATIPPSPGA